MYKYLKIILFLGISVVIGFFIYQSVMIGFYKDRLFSGIPQFVSYIGLIILLSYIHIKGKPIRQWKFMEWSEFICIIGMIGFLTIKNIPWLISFMKHVSKY